MNFQQYNDLLRKRRNEFSSISDETLNDFLMDVALNHDFFDFGVMAIKKITDENCLVEIACKTDNDIIGFEALKNIKSLNKIKSIALNAKLISVRKKALKII